MKRIVTLIMILAAITVVCSGCSESLLDYFDYNDDVHEYAMIAQPGDFAKLDVYPNLSYLDLRGSTCYEEILAYADANPHIAVRYNVQIGQKRFNQDTEQIILYGYDVDSTSLMENLKYLPNIKSVRINQITMSAEELASLTAAYPNITFAYSVEVAGQSYEYDITEMDLARITPDQIPQAVAALQLLPNLTDVMLSDESGQSRLALHDMKQLVDTAPQINFHYYFTLFEQTISLTDKEMIFDSVEIGNEGIAKIREALDLMPRCTYVKLDSCDVDDNVMAQLREDYPEKIVVWRVYAGKYSILTDEEMLRMPISLTDKSAAALQYCNKIKYLDVSQSNITNISFISSMPNLECAILSVTRISDLSPLANCPNLIWLEVANCSGIKDLSPLSTLTNLKYLNISLTKVSDLSALDALNLERLKCVKTSTLTKDIETFSAKHPNCRTTATGSSQGLGWRYEDANQKTIFPYYEQLVEIFRYNEKSYTGNRKE